ncbi:MAG: hypothetical protein IPH60_17780 [Flavobacteriales bacterium]|nr:hypothetical protein [Flavobacteriales bacterium]
MSATSDTIDLRSVFRKIRAKWWLFLLTVPMCVGAALFYLKTTPKKYEVQSVLLLGEKKRSGFGDNSEFIKGTSYLSNSTELEDKITVLTSNRIMTSTLQRLGFGITYFETKYFKTQEHYTYPPFFIRLDSVAVRADRSAHPCFRGYSIAYLPRVLQRQECSAVQRGHPRSAAGVVADLRVGPDRPDGFNVHWRPHELLINFPEDRTYDPKSDYYFVLNSLQDLVTSYRNSTAAVELSDKSNVVYLSLQVEVVNKGVDFLNKLMETYIEFELDKQQRKGVNTIEFIDKRSERYPIRCRKWRVPWRISVDPVVV